MKKILSLMLISVICLFLCSCGTCNCGCCEKVAAEAAVAETVPEETQSQEEKLTELLVSEPWAPYSTADTRYIFLRNGYGLYEENGDHDDGRWLQWVLDGNRLLVMIEPGGGSDYGDLYTFDEERGAFSQKIYYYTIHNYVEEYTLIPESRLAEFE